MEDYRRKLEQLSPNVTLTVELPHSGNGDLYQVRTTIAGGVIFYGRASSEDEAILKCCQKAVKHLMKNNNNNVEVEEYRGHRRERHTSKQQPLSPVRPPRRRDRDREVKTREYENGGRPSRVSARELELRNEMGSVLDRVAEWSRYYDKDISTSRSTR